MCSRVASPDLTQTAAPGSPRCARLRRGQLSCLRRGDSALKALVTGLCALVLVYARCGQAGTSADLGSELARHVATLERSTSVIRFFRTSLAPLRPALRGRRRWTPSRTSYVGRGPARAADARAKLARHKCAGGAAAVPRVARALAAEGDLSRLRLVLRGGAARRTLRVRVHVSLKTASTSASSRRDRAGDNCSVTTRLPSSRRKPPAVTSSARDGLEPVGMQDLVLHGCTNVRKVRSRSGRSGSAARDHW